mgnify:CR=1 FL=1
MFATIKAPEIAVAITLGADTKVLAVTVPVVTDVLACTVSTVTAVPEIAVAITLGEDIKVGLYTEDDEYPNIKLNKRTSKYLLDYPELDKIPLKNLENIQRKTHTTDSHYLILVSIKGMKHLMLGCRNMLI